MYLDYKTAVSMKNCKIMQITNKPSVFFKVSKYIRMSGFSKYIPVFYSNSHMHMYSFRNVRKIYFKVKVHANDVATAMSNILQQILENGTFHMCFGLLPEKKLIGCICRYGLSPPPVLVKLRKKRKLVLAVKTFAQPASA